MEHGYMYRYSESPSSTSPVGNVGNAETTITDRCAFATARRYAAQHRNYDNCLECATARQKCERSSDGPACDRCIKLNKKCNQKVRRDTRRTMDSGSTRAPAQRDPGAGYEKYFGKILYVKDCGGGHVEITHVRVGNNGVQQVYRSKCDVNYVAVAPPDYLGTWIEFADKFRESMVTVDIQDMLDA